MLGERTDGKRMMGSGYYLVPSGTTPPTKQRQENIYPTTHRNGKYYPIKVRNRNDLLVETA